jgi:hypothetical protein
MTDFSKYGTPINAVAPKGGMAVAKPATTVDFSKYGKPITAPAEVAPTEVAVNESPAWFKSSPEDTALTAGLKTVGNVLPSAWSFAKGTVKMLNPVEIAKNIQQVATEAPELVREAGGVLPAIKRFAKEVPGAAYQTVVPQGTKSLIGAAKGFATGDTQAGDVALAEAQKSFTEDPFANVAPYVLAAKGIAEKAGVGKQFDTAVSKVASPVTKTASGITNLGVKAVTAPIKYATSKLTGFEPETIKTITEQTKAFSKPAMATADRPSLGNEIKTKLDQRKNLLSETGAGYESIRNLTDETGAPHKVVVDRNYIDKTIKETTGLDIKQGKLQTSGSAKLREARDVRALQNIYDIWKPEFQKGYLTTEEFLNFRSDLGKMAKFERDIGKSKPLEDLSGVIRGKLNTTYRGQIPELENIDADFASQISELNNLKKGVLDSKGNLTDTAVNKIANATGKAKPQFLDKLEEISPGITQKIKVVKAIEDIERAGGNKVGTYTKSAIEGGGLLFGAATGNIPMIVGSIVTAILSSPEAAVPILRSYGFAKQIVGPVIKGLKAAANKVNTIPETMPAILNKDIEKMKLPTGPGKYTLPKTKLGK